MSNALEILGANLGDIDDELVGADDVEALLGGYDIVGATRRRRQRARAVHSVAAQAARQALAAKATYVKTTEPNRSNRIILPMTSSGNITTSATVTARPQSVAYRPEKMIVGGTPADWLIDDIKVGNRSQFAQAGSIPAEAFASNALGNEVAFETVQTAMDFVVQVTYLGTSSTGDQFRSVVFGTSVDR